MATPHRHGILHRERKIVGTAEHVGNFSTLVSAIRSAGMESALDGVGPFTLFAPTDAAFRKLPAGSVEGLMNDRGRLASFLKSHVVPGTIMAKDSFSTKSVKTLEGGDINFDTCDEFKVNGAKVVMPDIECRNGVLHGVDTVLVPVEPPARTMAAAPVPAATAPAPATAPAREPVSTCQCTTCGEQISAPTQAEAQRKLMEHEKVQHKETIVKEKAAPAAKCAPKEPAVKEKMVEKPVAKTVAPAPAATAQKCVPKETVVKERVVERPREKTMTKEVMSDRPIAQCTTCGEQISGTSAEDTKRKLMEHERMHKEAAVRPKMTSAERSEVSTCECVTCGEKFTGSTPEEAQQHLVEHEKVQHKGIRGTLREGAERLRGGAREGTGGRGEPGGVSEKMKESTSNVTGKTGAAAAGAAGAIGAGAGAVAGGARGMMERAGEAIRGKSGQYSIRCPECGEEITGATREEAQANLTEHGKVHMK